MIKPGKPVKDISIKKGDTIESIFDQMSKSGGFESKNLVDGLNILTSMIEDKSCLKFMSFVGAVVSTGLRGVITDMVKNKMCDVIITTCVHWTTTLQDIIPIIWKDHLQWMTVNSWKKKYTD